MKQVYFLTFITSLALQTGIMAQPNNDNNQRPAQRLEVQVQRLPSNSEPATTNDAYTPRSTDELRANQKIERTLSILKPDALRNRHIGGIISRFEDSGLRVVGIKMVKLTPEQASQFYNIHRERPFFPELTKYMSSGPIIVLALEGDQAISKNRQLMGATDPKKAEKGTIRADFAKSVTENAVHGSDSPEAAKQEIMFFFRPNEIYAGD